MDHFAYQFVGLVKRAAGASRLAGVTLGPWYYIGPFDNSKAPELQISMGSLPRRRTGPETLRLREGKNRLLLKIWQGNGEWAFYFAFSAGQ
jgi:hypothetical protein